MNGPDKRMLEREVLRNMIQQWNVNRLDLFELSEPNEDLSFHGVMRFYFQDSGQKVATKCIRVASDATAADVIETLIEKFRPDMRMLSVASYALYELHSHEERKLGNDEKPLLVQLNWHIDDREGRFLLKNVDHKTSSVVSNVDANSNFKRKLSKREKKELKKKEKLSRMKSDAGKDEDYPVAEKLYNELPETSFTRSISNPEAVMRRRRQQKLERKLQQFRSKDGGPDTGGTLKIYGESLCSDVPYKTLLLSINDCAAGVVKEMLDKYGLGKLDSQLYCLVQVDGHDNSEYILDDDECPLAIVMTHPHRGSIMFHVRRRPADCQPRRRKKKSGSLRTGTGGPCAGLLLETQPDGTPVDNGRSVRLATDVVEVGSASGVALQLYGPNIQPRHCVVAAIDGMVTITPVHADAHTYINGQQIYHTTILQHGCLIKFGRTSTFRFVDPSHDNSLNRNLSQSQHFDSGSVYDRSPVPDSISGMMSPSIHSQLDGLQSSIETSGMNVTDMSDLHRAMSPTSASNNTMTGSQENFPLTPYNGKNQRHSTDSISAYKNNNNHLKGDGESMILPGSANSKADIMQENYFSPNYNDMMNSQSSANNKEEQTSTNKNYGMEYKDNYETTFDLDGNVETKSVCSIKSGGSGNDSRLPRGQEAILPAVLEFPEHTQQLFLHSVITELDVEAPTFKLAPVYTLYMCARYRASTHYRPELTPTERAHKLTALLQHVATLIQNTVQERHGDASAEAFWMANGSELLHFLKSDRHISAFSTQAQNILAHSVQTAFSNLVGCFHVELSSVLSQWLEETVSETAGALLLGALGSAMALLRRCRVNAALTIQLFSQLFHFINVWCFNKVVHSPHMWRSGWGTLIRERLAPLAHWAERQGLEIAADCHLATIHQCAHLLQAPKNTVEDMVSVSASCFKLNSVQLTCLLGGFIDDNGRRLAPELVQAAVQHAQGLADELHRADGREITLEESSTLPLSLLIPEDGFSTDVVRGLVAGLAEFLAPLQRAGLCRLTPQPHSQGHWTVYMNGYQGGFIVSSPPQQPLVQVIKLHKNSNGMGLSIVAAKGAGQSKLGIYIKSVVPGGAAAADQRLQAGDQLLSVDGHSLVGISQERAAEFLVRTGPVVTLEVAKQGAVLHGLATLLRQPSPNRGYLSRNPSHEKTFLSSSDNSLNNISYRIPVRNSIESDDSIQACTEELQTMQILRSPTSHLRHLQNYAMDQMYNREQCVDCNYYMCNSDCSFSDCPESNIHDHNLKSSYMKRQCNTDPNIYHSHIDDSDEIPYIDETDSEPLIFEHKTCMKNNECYKNSCEPSVRMLFSNSSHYFCEESNRQKSCDIDVNVTINNQALKGDGCGTKKNDDFIVKPSAVSIGVQSDMETVNDSQCSFHYDVNLNDKKGNVFDYSTNDILSIADSSCSSKSEVNIVENGSKYTAKVETNVNRFPPDKNISSNVNVNLDNKSSSSFNVRSSNIFNKLNPGKVPATKSNSKKKQVFNPNDLKLGLGKVKALVGHFDKLRLTYQASYKKNFHSSPNLYDAITLKYDVENSATLSQSLDNVSQEPTQYNVKEDDSKLSPEEYNAFLMQLEDWSKYGTKAKDILDLEKKTKDGITKIPKQNFEIKQKSSPQPTRRFLKVDIKDTEKKSPLNKRFGSLEKLTGSLEPRDIKLVKRKSVSTPNVKYTTKQTSVPQNSDVGPKKKFPYSYIVRKSSKNTSEGSKNLLKKLSMSNQNLPLLKNLTKDKEPSSAHHSCPNLIGRKADFLLHKVKEHSEISQNVAKKHKNRPSMSTALNAQGMKWRKHPNENISPRRMSERDLPSTLEAEQSGQHGMVKSSKSVPALHEVFNPGYSRTSSSNSIPTLAGLRNRSSQQSHQHNDPNNFYQNLSTYKHTGFQDRSLSLAKGNIGGSDHPGTQPVLKGGNRPQSAYCANPPLLTTQQLHAGYPSMPNVNESYNTNPSVNSSYSDSPGQPMKGWKGSQPVTPRTPMMPHPSHQNISHQQVTSPHQLHRSQYLSDEQNQQMQMNVPMSPTKQQPPVAPKPQGMKRGASGEMISQDVVEGPPLPPTATHPLYQQNDEVGGSYLASSSEPPAVSLYPHAGVTSPPQALSNPWHREEREKELEARRVAARVWRDKQISALQSLGEENRTPQQEQQLRALTLERDFQRRAQEAQTEEEEKNHDQTQDNTFQENQDVISQQKQENITTQSQETKVLSPQMPLSPPVQPKSILKSNLRLDNLNSNSPQSPSKAQKNTSFVTKPPPQSLKFDNMPKYEVNTQQSENSKYDHNVNNKMYKSEYNNIKYPEQMHKMLGKYQHQDYPYNNLNSQNLSKFEHSMSENNVPLSQLSQNINNMTINTSENYMRGESAESQQRYETQLQEETPYQPPPPPERGSSFVVMSQQQALRSSCTISDTSVSQPSRDNKRVSFHHNSQADSSPSEIHQVETLREDPDKFISEAESMLQSPTTPTGSHMHTPGVIGAQEVYRDPRQRRLAEQQKAQQAENSPIPEKLSFKEKMKMFALESGESNTPKDKVKISRAQRDIDAVH